VIPAYEEGESINACMTSVFDAVKNDCEVLVVYDFPEDSTVPYLEKFAAQDARLRPTLNELGRGPAYAIRAGMAQATAPVVVVMMADGSDDVSQIDALTEL